MKRKLLSVGEKLGLLYILIEGSFAFNGQIIQWWQPGSSIDYSNIKTFNSKVPESTILSLVKSVCIMYFEISGKIAV